VKTRRRDQLTIAHDISRKHLNYRLIKWFKVHQRDLPWRKTHDPYAIWLSEMMLQQTQVVTVIPYYQRFLKHFASIDKLAEAPLEEVLKLWAGLGYYRRAKHLHQAAKIIRQQFGDAFPSTVEELGKLPGIGRYTAGAVASIAFDRQAAVLDGNVMRVLTRLGAIRGNIALPAAREALWTLAERLVPRRGAGVWNQALMELGATVCLPKNPRCDACPVRNLCRARALGLEEKLPVKHAERKIPTVHLAAVVIDSPRGFLLAKRGAGGLWEHLWEFPTFSIKSGSNGEDSAVARLRKLLGPRAVPQRVPGKLVHRLTHRVLYYSLFYSRVNKRISAARFSKLCASDGRNYEAFRWIKNLDHLPVAKITRRIAEAAKIIAPASD